MKKMLAMILATALIVGLVGCGEESEKKQEGESRKPLTEETSVTTEEPKTIEVPENPTTTDNPVDTDPKLSATDMAAGSSGSSYTKLPADETYITAMNEFAMRMFKESVTESEGANCMISPLSAVLAFAMLENGADNETLTQMMNALFPGMDEDLMNRYLATYMETLNANEYGKLGIANSIWIKDTDDFVVEDEFLKKNATFYHASVFRAPFDDSTVDDINAWVNAKTEGMIPKVLESLDETSVMCLINAIVFECNWAEDYEADQVYDDIFTKEDGTTEEKKMLVSEEGTYLSDDNTVGCVKAYEGAKFGFAVLLPDEGISLSDYVASLTAEKWQNLWNTRSYEYEVTLRFPEFSYDSNIGLLDMMQKFGMTDVFDGEISDLSRLGHMANGNNLFVSDAFQMTHIEVDRNGTKATAVTTIIVDECTAVGPEEVEYKEVNCDRPFVYAIVDYETGIPVFIGTMAE